VKPAPPKKFAKSRLTTSPAESFKIPNTDDLVEPFEGNTTYSLDIRFVRIPLTYTLMTESTAKEAAGVLT
jgi:hypothetical protein